MPIPTGQSLSFYQVLGPLGTGGMGEVYRARDTRLDREVAIKVLPDEFTKDDERLFRFEREAKSLAALNHTNIGGIYGVDQDDDVFFLVLELVPGDDLSTRIAHGAMPMDEALDLCRQIADGLEVAHESGVIHRDLKPANIRVTPQGVVKILDFGLAKPTVLKATRDLGSSVEAERLEATEDGVILGTPAYMSPEQARGKLVDRRTDIWAFGCVLYECLSGKRTFDGESFADVAASIVESEPDLSALPPVPPYIKPLLQRCLAKDPRQRLRDIGEARIQLERGGESDPVGPSSSAVQPAPAKLIAAALVCLLAGAALAWGLLRNALGGSQFDEKPRPKQSVHLSIPARTNDYSAIEWPSISPDGETMLVNAKSRDSGEWSFWLRRLDSFEIERVPELDLARKVFWTTDSNAIGYELDGQLHLLPLDSRVPRALPVESFRSAASSPSGAIVYGEQEGPLWYLPPDATEAQPLTKLDLDAGERWHEPPTFLKDGDRFVFLAVVRRDGRPSGMHRLYSGALSTGEVTLIGELPTSPYWSERDELIYAHDGWVRSVPFDAETMTISGTPRTLADGVLTFSSTGFAHLSVARNGSFAFQGAYDRDEILWVDKSGLDLEHVVGPGSYGLGFALSPDGESLAVCTSDTRTRFSDIWIYGLERDTRLNLTKGYSAWAGFPCWAPDSQSLYFASDARGYPDIVSIPLNTPGQGTIVWGQDHSQFPLEFMPGSTDLLAASQSGGLWIISPTGEAQPIEMPAVNRDAFLTLKHSPDGRFVAYSSENSGRREVYLHERADRMRTVQISVSGGESPEWSADGHTLYFLRGDHELWEVDLSSEEDLESPTPRRLFQSQRAIKKFAPSKDSERFLIYHTSEDTSGISVVLR